MYFLLHHGFYRTISKACGNEVPRVDLALALDEFAVFVQRKGIAFFKDGFRTGVFHPHFRHLELGLFQFQNLAGSLM